MPMTELRGILTAMATPFDETGAVDEAATRALARFLLENGSHGLVAAATSGESTTLDDVEHIGVLRMVVDEVGGEGPIVCGTGTNDTCHTIELTKAAAEAGAEAALVVTPYYNKPNPAGVRAHFEAVEAGDLERAREVESGLRPLFEALAVTTNPMPVKAALAMVGTIPSGAMR